MTTLGDVIYWLKQIWTVLQPIFEALLSAFKGGEEAGTDEEPVQNEL